MDDDMSKQRAIFLEVHAGLPRQGPGNRQSTLRALALAQGAGVPAAARILDIGCGPGAQTVDLANALPHAQIEAVDAHPPFLGEAQRRVDAAGLADRVGLSLGDMRNLAFAPASFDVLWCEGAVYVMGVAAALGAWRALLKPGGIIAFTDCVWLHSDVPADLRAWWLANYASMTDIDGCRDQVAQCGYRIVGDFVLPHSAWWDTYYQPMAVRIESLSRKYAGDEDALAALATIRFEIDTYRQHGDRYGYVFIVAVT
ncbi:MAG: class I SAM-dependent methyltransferase [Gammaproteobacteria bacterium]|nr:class I SAM-dependent methyltransferase [Gammaproteobacteria bacterium]